MNTEAGQFIDPLHHLALLTAAICHDLDHPGTNNAFQVNSSSALAVRYNDASVLENHHCATAWDILYSHGADVLICLDAKQRKTCRSLMISSILMTDMTSHFSLQDRFKTILGKDDTGKGISVPEGKDEETKKLITNVLLHCADLSNPTRPWKMAEHWGRLVGEEFEAQVTSEKELGIPVSSFMHSETEEARNRNEIGFIKGIITPWWTFIATAFPDLEFALEEISANIKNYENAAAEAAAKGI
jgi:high affinity cGMP-specific 3',5'-cyclic phosphodiesterase 9